MIVEDKNIKKTCSFYVSEFHLEMILVPYINAKIANDEKVTITTENNLQDTMEFLMSKVNLKEKNKEKILGLGWNRKDSFNISEGGNIVIIGTEEYINNMNKKIEKSNIEEINIINCYNFEDSKDNITKILNSHDSSLNTMGFENI